MSKTDNNWVYSLLIVLQSFVFGLIDVFGKIAFRYVNVIPFVCFRFLIATIALLLLYGKTTIQEFKTVPCKHYILPAICLSTSIIMSNIAINVTQATSYSFIRSLSAIMVPILLCIFFKRKYTVFDFVLQTTLVIGLYLLCAKGGLSGFGLGEILAVGSSLLIAINLVWGKKALSYVSTTTLTTAQMIFGFVFVTFYGLVTTAIQNSNYQNFLMPKVILILLFNALVGTVGGYTIQNVALNHISSKVVGIVQSFYPVATFLIAHFLLGESLTGIGLVGAFLIVSCVVIQGTRS